MFEQVSRVRRYALPKQQPGPYQTVKSRLQRSFILARHRSQQAMREFSPNHRSDLRNLLCRTKPVKPRHQRGMEARGNGQRRCRDRRNRPLGVVLITRLKYRLRHFLDEQRYAIGALHDVLPDMREQRLIAAVDHGSDFALAQPIDSQGCYVRLPNPLRFKFGPVRSTG